MTARSTCLSPFCGARVAQRTLRCPACGRPMFGDDDIARRGWHVLQLGLILAALMAASTWMLDLLPAIAQAPQTAFRGTHAQAWLLLLAFGSIALAGIAFIASSLLMITGRSSRATTIAAILLMLAGLVAVVMALVSFYRA